MDVLLVVFLLTSMVLAQSKNENKTSILGNIKSPSDCCPLPRLMNRTIADKCNLEFKNRTQGPGGRVHPTEGSCIEECILRTTGGYNATNKTLNIEAVRKTILATAANSTSFLPLFNSTIDYCHSIISKDPKFSVTPVSPMPGEAGCSFLPTALMNCIKIELFKKCPKNRWLNVPGCEQLKQKLVKGASNSSISTG